MATETATATATASFAASTSLDASTSAAISQLDSICAAAPSTSSAGGRTLKQKRRARREEAAVSTPALMALLPAARQKKRRRLSAESSTPASPGSTGRASATYNPTSLDALLERLATFSLTLWNDGKPDMGGGRGRSAVQFARYGWRCTGKRREHVECTACAQEWTVPSVSDWQHGEAGRAAAVQLQEGVAGRHARACPWRHRPCPDNLYRLPLAAPPSQLYRDMLARAATFPASSALAVGHPLSDVQFAQLATLDASHRAQVIRCERSGNEPEAASQDILLASLLGWQAVSHTPAGNVEAGTPASTIVQCRYCARRVLVKSAQSAAEASDSATARPSPTFDIRSSHRRFCAYLAAQHSDVLDRPIEGWEALLDVLLNGLADDAGGRPWRETVIPAGTETVPSRTVQTSEALRFVRELLKGGIEVKSKHRSLLL